MRGTLTAAREVSEGAESLAESRPRLRLIIDNGWRWPKDKRARRFAEKARWYIIEESGKPWAEELAEALAACERAIAIEPSYNWGYVVRASILLCLDRRAEALEAADLAIGLNPKLGWPYQIRAESLIRLGRFDEALVSVDAALAALPLHRLEELQTHERTALAYLASEVFQLRSGALEGLGDFDQALAAAERAIEFDGDSSRAHGRHAAALFDLDRLEDALKAIERACEISPRWSRGHAARAGVLIGLGRLDEAVTAIELTCDLEPEFIRHRAFRELLLRIGESKAPGYTGGQHGGHVGETAEYYAAADDARDRGLSPGELQEAIEQKLAEKGKAAARETTGRATAEPRPEAATTEATTQKANNGPEWPSEKWIGSPEWESRKHHQIIAFLRRVWKPFIENNKVLVTPAILKDHDAEAGRALEKSLRYHALPSDIPIITSKQLRQHLRSYPVKAALSA